MKNAYTVMCAVAALMLIVLIGCSSDNSTQPNDNNKAPSVPVIDAAAGAPSHQAGAHSIVTTLDWTCTDPDGDTLLFDVYFGTQSTPPKVVTNLKDKSYDPGTLDYATKYYWRVVAKDDGGLNTSSPVWEFTTTSTVTNHPPRIPTINTLAGAPADSAIGVALDVTLAWVGLDPDQDDLFYDLYVSNSTPPMIAASNLSESSFDPGIFAFNTTFYWQIVARDEHGLTTASPIWQFRTTTPPPTLLVSPHILDFTSVQNSRTFAVFNNGGGVLTWSLADDADWLTVQPTSGSTQSETDSVTVTVNRTGLADGLYTARVIVTSNGGTDTVMVGMVSGSAGLVPLTVGNYWIYDYSGDYQQKLGITGSTTVDYGGVSYSCYYWNWFESVDGLPSVYKALVSNRSDGFWVVGLEEPDGQVLTPFLEYEYPVHQGDTWISRSGFSGDSSRMECIAEHELLTVVAGTFDCVRYRQTLYYGMNSPRVSRYQDLLRTTHRPVVSGGQSAEVFDVYISPGIGLVAVRYYDSDGGWIDDFVLSSYFVQ